MECDGADIRSGEYRKEAAGSAGITRIADPACTVAITWWDCMKGAPCPQSFF